MPNDQDRLRAVTQAIAVHRAAIGQLTGERDDLVRALHGQGLSLRDIAALTDVSHVTVGEIVNGQAYGAGARCAPGYDTVVELLEENSDAEIAELTGLSIETVRQYIRDYAKATG
jgi:DNA-directed RNA polymerase specialized sigma24 family protein